MLDERVEDLLIRTGTPRRTYPRQEQEWELVEMMLGQRLPTDFRLLSDRCQELRVGNLEVHIPRLEEVSFPVGSPARLNLRTRLEEEISADIDSRALFEGEVRSAEAMRTSLEELGRVVLEDADSGERSVFSMAPGRFELVPWGSHPSGAVGYWHAVGDPDTWPVLVSYSETVWREECSLVDYLLRTLDGGTSLPWLVEDTF
ncbi:hypothetical protein ACFVWN_00810 [Nocardiopsis flavescens]|uniref:hypothetical protein n=1 Tax=Nocardiopsis flavescens TaxID=758803 RepID=UPI00366629A1